MLLLTSQADVGLYQASYRLGTVMMIFVQMFEFAWRPFFLQQSAKENARELYARIFTYFNVIAGLIFLAISFYVVNIAAFPLPGRNQTLINSNYWSGLVIVPIVLAAYIFQGWYTNFIVGIYIEKRTSALPGSQDWPLPWRLSSVSSLSPGSASPAAHGLRWRRISLWPMPSTATLSAGIPSPMNGAASPGSRLG